MRILTGLGLGLVLAFAAVLGLSAQAQAAPASAGSHLSVLADHNSIGVGVGVGVGGRPYGYRYAGGYYRTDYQWVWVGGGVAYYDAFGRPVMQPGHWAQRPVSVWVPHTVYYARPHYRPYGVGGFHVGGGFRIR